MPRIYGRRHQRCFHHNLHLQDGQFQGRKTIESTTVRRYDDTVYHLQVQNLELPPSHFTPIIFVVTLSTLARAAFRNKASTVDYADAVSMATSLLGGHATRSYPTGRSFEWLIYLADVAWQGPPERSVYFMHTFRSLAQAYQKTAMALGCSASFHTETLI
jgi:hypothetical protein